MQNGAFGGQSGTLKPELVIQRARSSARSRKSTWELTWQGARKLAGQSTWELTREGTRKLAGQSAGKLARKLTAKALVGVHVSAT